jgi:hypothetical protein
MATAVGGVFFSHSTHDMRDSILAHKLATGLASQGVKVWIAPESIPPGERWEEALVAAIIEKSTHFVVIISESSIRSAWVLREVDFIRQRSLRDADVKILPLRMGKGRMDFEGAEFLRTFQDLPFFDQFAMQLRTLAQALGLPPLVPAIFRSLIADTTKHFVGRERVFAAIQQFLATERKGSFLLIGEPGQGKTTVLAEYVRRVGCPAHFNIGPAGIDSAEQFFESIQSQLGTNYGVSTTPDATAPSTAVRLAELLDRAGAARPVGEPLVIVIDALDEVKDSPADGHANILHLPPVLSDGVFLLMSGRPREYHFVSRDPQATHDLRKFPAENRHDIETYLRDRMAGPEFETWLNKKNWTVDRAVNELSHRSENNFMYLHYVLQDIERGNLEQLPTGLSGYYNDHWRRMGMLNRPMSELKLDVLQLLALVRGPVSARLIADVLSISVSEVRAVLDEWHEFLQVTREDGPARYRLYHSSFQQFLLSKEAIQDLDPMRWMGLLADYFGKEATS